MGALKASTLLLIFLSALALPMAVADPAGRSSACTGGICINEIIPNPAGYDNATYPGGEWVELVHEGSISRDVRGWSLVNEGGYSLTLNATTIVGWNASDAGSYTLSPGEYMVVARNGLSDFYLANSGARSLDLVNDGGTTLHTVTWTGSSSGMSYERDANTPTSDLVATSAPTPGEPNDGSGTTTLQGPFSIVEVMADPWPSSDDDPWPGGEWVELKSTASSDESLVGWSIVDNAGNSLLLDGNATFLADGSTTTTVPPNGRVIVATNGSALLNNAGERLDLLWPNGTLAQRLTWTLTEPGFALQDGGSGSMVLAAHPTPFEPEPPLLGDLPRMQADLRFEELLVMAEDEGGPAADAEWVEVHNAGTVPVDLTGWSIGGGLGNLTLLEAINITQPGTGTVLEADERALVHFTEAHRLWNATDILRLLDPTGEVKDVAHWTSSPGTGVALVRAANPVLPWVPTTVATPGTNGSAPSTAPELRLNEILASRSSSDGTGWVEVRNLDDASIDLAGWSLLAPQRSMTVDASMISAGDAVLAPNDVAVIDLGQDLLLSSNGEDILALMSPDNQVVQEVSWDSLPAGESLIPANQSHAGAGPQGLNRGPAPGWDLSAWPTPGSVEPVWPAWTAGAALEITEVMPFCDTGTPGGTWVELHNTASEDVNASRWRLEDANGRSWFVRPDRWWTPNATGEVLPADARGVLMLDTGDSVAGTLVLHDPDGTTQSSVDLSNHGADTCTSLIHLDQPRSSPWPTPGTAEPDQADVAGPEDLLFTALLVDGALDDGDVEFIELRNTGDRPAVLDGWTLERLSSTSNGFASTVTSLRLEAGASITLTADADRLSGRWDGTIANMTDHLDASVFLHDQGGALRLLAPDGAIADAVVWGDGPVGIDGWNGVALTPPINGLERVVHLRGSGCNDDVDTDTAQDWRLRWTRIGASTPCVDQHLSDLQAMRPIIGPEAGVVDLVQWIDGATTSLQVQVYQITEANMVHALIRAAERGVEVQVVMDAGDDWWDEAALRNVDGMAASLSEAGIEVLLHGAEDDDAYAFMHAKIAVRDHEEVWLGSGNWKPSSAPGPGEDGNRDWSIIVESEQLVEALDVLLAMDRDPSSLYVRPAEATAPVGWTLPPTRALSGSVSSPVPGVASGELLTCPDDCIAGITGLLDEAEEEILLSLQYLELDWTWGWGDNPLLTSIHDAAARGVHVRVVLNGAYLDDEVQEVVDLLNEDWNASKGLDVSAVLMSPGEGVTKLHNKGAIVDREHVLISSINWGDSAMLRNREIGLIVHDVALASVYLASWQEDWDRLDDQTDTDNDGLIDAWEVLHGTRRTQRTVSSTVTEAMLDPDGDGLTHLEEASYGSDPFSNDTDNDCILDDVEVARALANPEGASASERLTKADADGDGVDDHTVEGCDASGPGVVDGTDPVNNNSDPLDADDDRVLDENDRCPNTPPEDIVDAEGCSADQRRALLNQGEEASGGMGWIVPVVALVGLLVALVGVMGMRNQNPLDVKEADIPVPLDQARTMPVLDGQAASDADLRSRLSGWDDAIIDERLSEGWTLQGLVDYYEQQRI